MPLMNIALTALLAAAGDAAPVAPLLIPPPAVVGPASAEKRAGPGNLDSQISGIPVPSGHHRPHETGAEHEQTTPS
jgi:hypothetical protein